MGKKIAETPMMLQYIEIKKKHPDAILLFRVGDFYETFSDDAIETSEILGITLTRRANGAAQFVELAGFPHHALDTYLPKLVRAGKRVAICDQLEDPKLTKSLVKRGVTELVTPGVSINDTILNHKENNFLCAMHIAKNNQYGIAFLDISTGEFLTTEGNRDNMDKLLSNFSPKEVLIEHGNKKKFEEAFGHSWMLSDLDDWIFTEETARDRLLSHFGTKSLKGFGVENMTMGIIASGVILYYLDITQHTHIEHINALVRIEEERFMRLDKFTVRSLELISTMNEGGRTLLDVLDKTISPMGARLLRRWIVFPLREAKAIEERLNVVENFFREPELKTLLSQQLALIGDLERIISKAAVGRITP
ncbi:MAG: DNA mismatch repair protein MutS, partial [Bacteroidales bacterium]|nr:DNA mismatch repair protein MutS [Bacteroidales bacterium]